MCDCCCSTNHSIARHSTYREQNHDPCLLPLRQRQPLDSSHTHNCAITTTQTQSCHQHTHSHDREITLTHTPPRPSQTLSTHTYHSAFPTRCQCQPSSRTPHHLRNQTLEPLLHELLSYIINNTDPVYNCTACQPHSQYHQCTTCTTDQQTLVSLLIDLIDQISTSKQTQTQDRIRSCNHKTACHSDSYRTTHSQRPSTCNSQTHCCALAGTREETQTLLEVLFRITRRRGQSRGRSRVFRSQGDGELCCVVRRFLDVLESGDGCEGCRGYLEEGNVRRLRNVVRDMEGGSDELGSRCGRCSRGCGGGRVESSKITVCDEPEWRRPRIGNVHVGWAL